MKSYFVTFIFSIFFGEMFSQQFGIGGFGSVMYHNFYNTIDAPHDGYKKEIQNKGGGFNFFYVREGRNIEGNLRYNSISFSFYSSEVDSIKVAAHETMSGWNNAVYFYGTQTTHYNFVSLTHSNFFKSKHNDFLYYIVGFQTGIVINNSSYNLPNFSSAYYQIDHTVKGYLPEKVYGGFLGLHVGAAYEFEKFFLHLNVNYDWSFYWFPDYSLGARWTIDLGVSVPIHFKKKTDASNEK